LISEWELWACANMIDQQHKDSAPDVIAEPVNTLTLEGDDAGATTWRAIAERYAQLLDKPERNCSLN
jgi:hypothetical protein